MDYKIVRDAPLPTLVQLGRALPADCCARCQNDDRPDQTMTIPSTDAYRPGMEQLAELRVGDALDGPRAGRNLLGLFYRAYDFTNKTKHEIYMQDFATTRCLRIK